jgi:alanine dehydrogenase
MLVGLPKEIKNNENRVAMTPAVAAALVQAGHEVRVQAGAGEGSGFFDGQYQEAGARIVAEAGQAWDCEMVVKVKEPVPAEYGHFRAGQILFTYLHLAPEAALTSALVDAGVSALAYETMEKGGSLPLLVPMSEVAGRMAVQVGAHFLEKAQGGRGLLLSGVPGVERGEVAILGGGVAGTNAAKAAIGLGARVTVLDIDGRRLAELNDLFGNEVQTLMANPANIAEAVKRADLAIGAVLVPGAAAPKLVGEEVVRQMKPGSVVVDIAIDQGGIFETTGAPTSHANPIVVKHGVLHYAVANMPGAVPRTSTIALSNATAPYVRKIADEGLVRAALRDATILGGINTHAYVLTCAAVAQSQGRPWTPARDLLENTA